MTGFRNGAEPIPDSPSMSLPVMAMADEVEPPQFFAGTGTAEPEVIGDQHDDQGEDDTREPGLARWEDAVGDAAYGAPIALSAARSPGESSKPGDGGWSVWIDHDKQPDEQPPTPAPRPQRKGTAITVAASVLILAACVTTAVLVNLQPSSPQHPDTPASLSLATPAPAPVTTTVPTPTERPNATAACIDSTTPQLTTGAGPGGTTTQTGVIQAFYWAYYVDRSAPDAYDLLAPGTTLYQPTPAELQDFIDAEVPADIRYCVHIAPDTASGAWLVDLDEQFPGEPVEHYRLRFTTVLTDGRAYITSVDNA